MITKLYTKEALDTGKKEIFRESGPLERKDATSQRLNCLFLLPWTHSCKRPSKHEKFFLLGMHKYQQDTDLVQFFKTFLELKEIVSSITSEVKKKQFDYEKRDTLKRGKTQISRTLNDMSGLDQSSVQEVEFEDEKSYVEMGNIAREQYKMKK